MADAARFPHLALPFAITGAAAGWLAAGVVQHPILYTSSPKARLVTAAVAAGLGGAVGLIMRRWCAPKRYSWEVGTPDPLLRPASDSWVRHTPLILSAGAIAGGVFAELSRICDVGIGALAGMLFALPVLPVCGAVLSAARRAQRARMGSLVAGSDRRAVWGILCIALLICSPAALPDWPAPVHNIAELHPASVAAWFLLAAPALLLALLAADLVAFRRAKRAAASGLIPGQLADVAEGDGSISRTDLGLGDDLHARVARAGAVYRSRDRTLSLVQGDPELALGALRKALRRGAAGLAIAGLTCAVHAAASTSGPRSYYQKMRCDYGIGDACGDAARIERYGTLLSSPDPRGAIPYFEHGCDRGDGPSCMYLAELYRGESGVGRDMALVSWFEYRAAQRGLCPPGTRLVRGTEHVCVTPDDPRH